MEEENKEKPKTEEVKTEEPPVLKINVAEEIKTKESLR